MSLLFETWGRPRRLKSFSANKKWGTQRGFCSQECSVGSHLVVVGEETAPGQTLHSFWALSQGPGCWLQDSSRDLLVNILICSERPCIKGEINILETSLLAVGLMEGIWKPLYQSLSALFKSNASQFPVFLKNHSFCLPSNKHSLSTYCTLSPASITKEARAPSLALVQRTFPEYLLCAVQSVGEEKLIFLLHLWALGWDLL